jgi:hypothetical protein
MRRNVVGQVPWSRESELKALPGRPIWWWLVAYGIVLGGIVFLVVYARSRILAELDTPQARQEWNDWRERELAQASQGGPVHRRPPSSAEPPALVLMRDYFPVVMTAAVAFTSLLFGVSVFFLRGVLCPGTDARENETDKRQRTRGSRPAQ